MPDHALTMISSQAGLKTPARHQTLSKLLKIVTTAPFLRDLALQTIESDDELLFQGLSVSSSNSRAPQSIVDWHLDVSDEAIKDMALSAANRELASGVGQPHRSWQRARLVQLLVSGIAPEAGFTADVRHRLQLLGGLLGLGHRLLQVTDEGLTKTELLEREQVERNTRGDKAGADWLVAKGFEVADADVLLYQYESVIPLKDAPGDIALVSLCGRFADSMLQDLTLPEAYLQVIEQRFGLELATVRILAENAYLALHNETDQLCQETGFGEYLAKANLGQQLESVSSEASLLEQGGECLGITDLVLARLSGEELIVDRRGDLLTASAKQGGSLLTQALLTQSEFTAEEDALAAIVDKQLFSRMAANVLWFLPSEQGVAVCGFSDATALKAVDPYLLSAFQSACHRLIQTEVRPTSSMIELDEVQRRIRELNHEVNNPLAIVQNYLKTLSLRLGQSHDAQGDIKTISAEMLRIGAIIQRYTEIGQQPEFAPEIQVNQVIEKLSRVVSGANPDIKLELELDDALPLLQVPEEELSQVLLNLMRNAVEALVADGVRNPALMLRTGQVNVNGTHNVEIMVEDNGPGIDPEVYANLFAPNNSSKGEGHSGIGLSVVNRLIMEMGGYISCRSSQSGSQFQILIPAATSSTT